MYIDEQDNRTRVAATIDFRPSVDVYHDMRPMFGGDIKIELNWSCYGSVDILFAKLFRASLDRAIQVAEEKQKQLSIK